MTEQKIIQTALTSIEMFDGMKKIEVLMDTIENAAQILGQSTICIAFSKLIGPPLLRANKLKTRSPNLKWTELKKGTIHAIFYHST